MLARFGTRGLIALAMMVCLIAHVAAQNYAERHDHPDRTLCTRRHR